MEPSAKGESTIYTPIPYKKLSKALTKDNPPSLESLLI